MYVIKTTVADTAAAQWCFERQKTMYGGKHIAAGDTVWVLASENAGGAGLVAQATVLQAQATARQPGVVRQTPRVSLTVQRTASAVQPVGRALLKACVQWDDGRPETELNFKLYRQATDKIVAISPATAAWLAGHCA